MKKALHILLLFVVACTLCGCPYSSAYNLDSVPTLYVEDALTGTWLALIQKKGRTAREATRQEAITVSLSKKTDKEYNISFTGYLEDLKPFNMVKSDSINGIAFMSSVDGRQFLNIRIYSRVYIAELILQDDKLSLLPLAEQFTNKMIRNSETLKTCVSVHYKTRVHPVFDDDFCLTDMVKMSDNQLLLK